MKQAPMNPSPAGDLTASVQAAAAAVGITIPDEYLPAVTATYAEISAQARLLMEFEELAGTEPAGVFQP